MAIQGWNVAGKAWTALGGAGLTALVPWLMSVAAGLPAPWPAVAAAVLAVVTAVGAYNAPYAPVDGGSAYSTGNGGSGNTGTPWPTA